MKYATIDIGNTRTKLGLFQDDQLIEQESFRELTNLSKRLKALKIDRTIVSSVKQSYEELQSILELANDTIYLTRNTKLPFEIDYQSNTLGIDRIALVAGALNLFPNNNCLVIDAGTCITYDYLTAQHVYKGGAISPGIQMRFNSLHNFTARLPLITFNEHDYEWLGQNTESSIKSGVINGVIGEVESFIDSYLQRFGDVKVILSGGNAKFFESRIKATIFALPELLLVGLNAILRHNASI